jgi:hypothetical protein
MKIDISRIVLDHLGTLRDAETRKISLFDISVFFLLPLVSGVLCNFIRESVSVEFYNVSITFFGIFIALLLNLQVAIFGIFLRKWDLPTDERLAEIKREKLDERNFLLGQLNANISYLILICCGALVFFLIMFATCYNNSIWAAVSVALYAHFMLTLIMVVKRAHALFQREYKD